MKTHSLIILGVINTLCLTAFFVYSQSGATPSSLAASKRPALTQAAGAHTIYHASNKHTDDQFNKF